MCVNFVETYVAGDEEPRKPTAALVDLLLHAVLVHNRAVSPDHAGGALPGHPLRLHQDEGRLGRALVRVIQGPSMVLHAPGQLHVRSGRRGARVPQGLLFGGRAEEPE